MIPEDSTSIGDKLTAMLIKNDLAFDGNWEYGHNQQEESLGYN